MRIITKATSFMVSVVSVVGFFVGIGTIANHLPTDSWLDVGNIVLGLVEIFGAIALQDVASHLWTAGKTNLWQDD